MGFRHELAQGAVTALQVMLRHALYISHCQRFNAIALQEKQTPVALGDGLRQCDG